MGAVASRYKAGELDKKHLLPEMTLCFSQGYPREKLIQQAIDSGEIPQSRIEESVKKILLTKYYLGLPNFKK